MTPQASYTSLLDKFIDLQKTGETIVNAHLQKVTDKLQTGTLVPGGFSVTCLLLSAPLLSPFGNSRGTLSSLFGEAGCTLEKVLFEHVRCLSISTLINSLVF
mgnify:CR=1 FL=1